MKTVVLATALAVSALFGATASAHAQGFSIQFGTPGYYQRPWWHHHHYYRPYYRPYYRSYYDDGPCRTIVRRHYNRWGELVIVRRRVCY